MGATLPTLTRYLSRDAAHLSSAFGRLYAANTIGAIIGTAAAGLVLIEVLGLSETLVVAAGCSALAGLTAIVLDRRRRASASDGVAQTASTTAAPEAMTVPDETADADPRPRIALVVAFVSGLTSLAYQVLWTRLLASGSGNYAYVFTLILLVFLAGIAIGAVVFTVVRRWIRHPVALLARTNIVIGVLALAGVVFVLSKPFQYTVQQGRIDGIIGVLFSQALLVVLPATIVMGLSFPASSALVAGRSGKIATSAGQLLAANTLGAIVGTFVVPFFVIPAIGSPDAIGVIALINVTLGLALAYAAPIRSAVGRVTTYGVGAVTAVVLVVALATSGILVDPSVANIANRNGELFASREDEIASVQAGSVNGFKQLWVTGASMTALTVDARLMVILPLDRATGFEGRPDRRVRDGLGLPLERHRGPHDGCGRAGALGAVDVRLLLPRRRRDPREPERPRDHRRRPEPHGADRQAIRHHRDRPAAADRGRRVSRSSHRSSTTRPATTA